MNYFIFYFVNSNQSLLLRFFVETSKSFMSTSNNSAILNSALSGGWVRIERKDIDNF
jgi:hypothetical protein